MVGKEDVAGVRAHSMLLRTSIGSDFTSGFAPLPAPFLGGGLPGAAAAVAGEAAAAAEAAAAEAGAAAAAEAAAGGGDAAALMDDGYTRCV